MIKFDNGGILVESLSELPRLTGHTAYIDFETSSGDPKKKSINPWHNCTLAGTAITVDQEKRSWYIPTGHNDLHWNLPEKNVVSWLTDTLSRVKRWTNHNVKYDAHVALNTGVTFDVELRDTLTGAKVVDSDRIMRGGYSLAALSEGWLKKDIGDQEGRVKAFLMGVGPRGGSKDYGDVPGDILGEYACEDVLTARGLEKYIEENIPEESRNVWQIEQQLTLCLLDMERRGMCIDEQEIKLTQYRTLMGMLKLEEKIHKTVGFSMRPHVNDDCFELLCNQWGLPVLAWTNDDSKTKTHNPSFDKNALASYMCHPDISSDPERLGIVEACLAYRKLHTLNSLFLETFLREHVNGVLHPDYNQAVRTGRMSCRRPNTQQQDEASKALIHPPFGYAFISMDYSQIEFRFIAHYLKNPHIIAAYAKDAETDFHQWVAGMCEIPRKPAKNINFAIGFGGGKKRILRMLAGNMDLVGILMDRVDKAIAAGKVSPIDRMSAFKHLATQRAKNVYEEYHATMPELKRVSHKAEILCRARGFVRNAYGRHRRLPQKAAHRAFPSIMQSSAADLMKERTVCTSYRFWAWAREHDIHQVASVHDETLFIAPIAIARDPVVISKIAMEMETTTRDFRVPIRVAGGVSEKSWADTGNEVNLATIRRC